MDVPALRASTETYVVNLLSFPCMCSRDWKSHLVHLPPYEVVINPVDQPHHLFGLSIYYPVYTECSTFPAQINILKGHLRVGLSVLQESPSFS
jgi:hypothetical protein